jgi:uncharacterized protein with von Willebrand factor type A (vWA) domain
VYETDRFSEPQSLDDLLHELGAEWKLVMVGDAAMHPAELLGAGDYEYYATGHHGPPQTGMKWLQKLADHFRRFAWLNPDPPNYWRGGTAEQIAKVFPMFQLTLDGLSDAITHLSKGDVRKR